jgi:hypothetical protein
MQQEFELYEVNTTFLSEILHRRDLGINGVILKWILK